MAEVLAVGPVVSPDAAARLIATCERFPVFTPSGTNRRRRRRARLAATVGDPDAAVNPRTPKRPPFAPGLRPREDSQLNFLRQGGLRGATDDSLLSARHKYFRETLQDGHEVYASGAEEYLANQCLAEAAHRLFGRDLVVPWNVYANVMLPGQELGMHTDTPEFRGAHRDFLPNWLLCAMHLSGLFEPWRVRIATGITHLLGSEEGGAFLCYPDGIDHPPARYEATLNTALVLDSDSIFHGVELVPGCDDAIGQIDANTRLVPKGKGQWFLRCGAPGQLETVAVYSREELRLSLSWKAYCFADEAECHARTDSADALNTETILEMFVDELVVRGRLAGPDHALSEEDLGMLIIDEFIRFPEVTPT
ncbi:MAG TPA: hypothetical protein VN886_08335 [Acidimicrobiales bacterium]|nr:hypothetical protein [Acidimicrobiales bacterium]